MLGQKEILSAYGGVQAEDIRGMRAPFLAIGGNNMFAMLQEANFTYDSSMPIYDNKAERIAVIEYIITPRGAKALSSSLKLEPFADLALGIAHMRIYKVVDGGGVEICL